MNNAERILRCLDRHLTKPVELVIYGRAALALGFQSPQVEHTASADVDAVVSINELSLLQDNEDFWNAQASVNAELEKDGLYFTHIFTDQDVIIRDGWEGRKVPIRMEFNNIRLFRPATAALILTKMMRDDPQDLADIKFMMLRDPSVIAILDQVIREAKVPAIPELNEQFT